MQYDNQKKQNIRPSETSNLPVITLSVLVLIVLALLYVGYEYIVDDTSGAEEITNVLPDSTAAVALENPQSFADNEETTAEKPAAEKPAPAVTTPKPAEEKPAPPKETPKPVNIGGQASSHTLAAGETLSSLSSRYNLKTETLKGLNPSVDFTKSVKPGDKINIRVKAIHTVGPGDVLRVVSEKYGITKQQLMKANGKDKDFAQRGEKLLIPFPDKQ